MTLEHSVVNTPIPGNCRKASVLTLFPYTRFTVCHVSSRHLYLKEDSAVSKKMPLNGLVSPWGESEEFPHQIPGCRSDMEVENTHSV